MELRRRYVHVEDLPMVGALYFGVVDRGTNVIEVRPTSLCPLSCIFCSVDAGPRSVRRWCEYTVELDALLNALRRIVKFKGVDDVEIHVDGMGDPALYYDIVRLVQEAKSLPNIKVVSMQSRLVGVTERMLEELAEAGLDRINLSLDATDPNLARFLAGAEWYDVAKVMELAEYVVENTRTDVVVSPVWLPRVNDEEMPKLIQWGRERLGKRWPPVLIQKYIPHKHGRRPKGIKPKTWRQFYSWLKDLELKHGVKLVYTSEVFNIHRARELPKPFSKGQVVQVEVVERGIFRGEYLAKPLRLRGDPLVDRVFTIVSERELEIGSRIKVRIIGDRHNIYIAKPLTN